MYSIQAHDGTIFALAYSDSYVISLGQDEKLCVWDRFQGHLLNTIAVVSVTPYWKTVSLEFQSFLNYWPYILFFILGRLVLYFNLYANA